MAANNPLFKNIERAAYELPGLFQILGEPSASVPLTEAQRHAAAAIQSHAGNAQEVILDGIETIGHLMSSFTDDYDLDRHHICNLGMLIKHLAVEADQLRNSAADMRVILETDCQRPLTAPRGRQS